MPLEIQKVSTYISTLSFKGRSASERLSGVHPFITISRQAGVGGHVVADAVIEEMQTLKDPLFQGWQIFDQKLCEMVAADPRFRFSLESLLTEHFKTAIEDYVSQFVAASTPQKLVVKKLFETIRTLALFGKAIIVGRGGMMAACGLPGGIHVRLVAPKEMRIHNLMQRHLITQAEAEKLAAVQDESRSRLLKTCFRKDIDDPLLYDFVFNLHNVPVKSIAQLLVQTVRLRADTLRGIHERAVS